MSIIYTALVVFVANQSKILTRLLAAALGPYHCISPVWLSCHCKSKLWF